MGENNINGALTLEDLDEIATSGAFSVMQSDEAFHLISDALAHPTTAKGPVDPSTFDVDAVEDWLIGSYVNATAPAVFGEALTAVAEREASVRNTYGTALCRASGLPTEAYDIALAFRDAGDPSLLLSLTSAYLDRA